MTRRQSGRQLVLMLSLVAWSSGCFGPKLATDLLNPTSVNSEPLRSNSVTIRVGINPRINNDEKLDETAKESLQIALQNANIFGDDPSQPYRIEAHISIASQARLSFGSFNGKLEIVYEVFDDSSERIINETIYTEAGSDKFYFAGAARHRRARAVNISKNVMQFVEILQRHLDR